MRYLISYGAEPPIALDVDQDHIARDGQNLNDAVAEVRATATRLAQWFAMEHHAPARVDWQEYAFLSAELVLQIEAV